MLSMQHAKLSKKDQRRSGPYRNRCIQMQWKLVRSDACFMNYLSLMGAPSLQFAHLIKTECLSLLRHGSHLPLYRVGKGLTPSAVDGPSKDQNWTMHGKLCVLFMVPMTVALAIGQLGSQREHVRMGTRPPFVEGEFTSSDVV